MSEDNNLGRIALPAQLIGPWIEEHALFMNALEERKDLLEHAHERRREFAIRQRIPCEASRLGAVDAAVLTVTLGDLASILVQVVHVDHEGHTTLGQPIRHTTVNGAEAGLASTPMRLAAECSFLAAATDITIADTSLWSMLMEVNQVITRYSNGGAQNEALSEAYDTLVPSGTFLEMLRNPYVIAMSKTNQSMKYGGNFVSDREILGRVLLPGEFLIPMKLVDSSGGKFGVEHQGFTDAERAEIQTLYEDRLGLTFFKPHPWSRAFRIEGLLSQLEDDAWLMPLLSAIDHHTKERTIEPWPQFLADWTSKQLSAVQVLFGEMNFHHSPYFDPSRTLAHRNG